MSTRPRLWFWKPEWYWFGWRTLSPIWFHKGGDEWHRHTITFGWTITGRVIIALWQGRCIDECYPKCRCGMSLACSNGTWFCQACDTAPWDEP